MIEQARAGTVLPITEQSMPTPAAVADALQGLMEAPPNQPAAVDSSAFDALSARASARALAEALDQACARRAA
jgi:hypothetical protein